jgi:hypothetical protein
MNKQHEKVKGPRGGTRSPLDLKPAAGQPQVPPKVRISESKLQSVLAEDCFRKGRLPADSPRRRPSLSPIKFGGES